MKGERIATEEDGVQDLASLSQASRGVQVEVQVRKQTEWIGAPVRGAGERGLFGVCSLLGPKCE